MATLSPSQPETLYEKHVKIRPRPVKGRFANLRKTALLVLLGIFHFLPFLQWNGRQAIFFDLPHRRFYIFSLNIWPQDFILLTFILLGLALLLFFATALLGRVCTPFTPKYSSGLSKKLKATAPNSSSSRASRGVARRGASAC